MIAIPLLYWYLTGANPYLISIDTIFGSINQVLLWTTLILIPMTPVVMFSAKLEYSEYKDKKDEIKNKINYLHLQLEKEKEILNTLKEDNYTFQQNLNYNKEVEIPFNYLQKDKKLELVRRK